MTDYQGLKEIIRKADEISKQANDKDYDNDTYRLKRALDLTARALSMFAKMEQERLDGEIVIHNPLEYVEARLCTALYYVMNPTKDGKRIDSPKP
ncbi:hypothetical protein [Neobacillus cucumis]|uniref:hypothetical protein n=1 Tax=Neobacillus cucumis TaxID=1740721 RepID=UPI0019646950|nr:hypothetical protein [Neobacillus cucumis]MBM7655559.1 hypothetical protein [Neobacillus cucumis]MED4226876.1 hypothetical protein [Neobacillus cucumis]